MTVAADIGAGGAVILALTLAVARPGRHIPWMLAAQSAAVMIAAVAGQAVFPALGALATGAAAGVLSRSSLPDISDTSPAGWPMIATAGVLSAVALSLGHLGIPLACLMLGMLTLARRRDVMGVLASLGMMLNAVLLAAIEAPAFDPPDLVAAIPALTTILGAVVLGFAPAELWRPEGKTPENAQVPQRADARGRAPGRAPGRAQGRFPERTARASNRSWLAASWVEHGAAIAAGLTALGCLYRVPGPGPVLALLAIVVALSQGWTRHPGSPVARGQRLAQLSGLLLACLLTDPVLSWGGLAVTALAAFWPIRGSAARRGPAVIAAAGTVLALFGIMSIASGTLSPLAGQGCLLIGLLAMAVAVPATATVLPGLLPRLLATSDASPLLIHGAMAAFLAAAGLALLWRRRSGRRRDRALVLAQSSLAAAAFGLGSGDGAFAGLVLLILLGLSQAALNLTANSTIGGGTARPIARLALSGVPPIGVFPGVALVLAAMTQQAAWLVPVALAGLAALILAAWPGGGSAVSPDARRPMTLIPFAPLALAVLAGWCMPEPAAAWLRDIVTGGHP